MTEAENHPTRIALLEAGLRLAETSSLSRLSVNQIVKEAGVAKGTFYVHFSDRNEYLVALHGRFYENLNAVIDAAIEGMPEGRDNLQRGIEAYLDGCLQRRALKALLVEARIDPAMATAVHQRNELYYANVADDFQAMGWPEPMLAARLFVTMVAEAAIMELEQSQRLTAVRQTLWQFLDSNPIGDNQ